MSNPSPEVPPSSSLEARARPSGTSQATIERREATDEMVDELVPLVREAGNPYYDWFFGGEAAALPALRACMLRPSSEISIRRVTLFALGDRVVGGLIALPGREVEGCRAADAVAALGQAGPTERAEILARMRATRGLFPPVPEDAFYGSKFWIVPPLRGHGLAGRLAKEFFAIGEEMGFRRFRGDVWAGNRSAVRLYEAYGFRTVAETTRPGAGMTYLTMIREA